LWCHSPSCIHSSRVFSSSFGFSCYYCYGTAIFLVSLSHLLQRPVISDLFSDGRPKFFIQKQIRSTLLLHPLSHPFALLKKTAAAGYLAAEKSFELLSLHHGRRRSIRCSCCWRWKQQQFKGIPTFRCRREQRLRRPRCVVRSQRKRFHRFVLVREESMAEQQEEESHRRTSWIAEWRYVEYRSQLYHRKMVES